MRSLNPGLILMCLLPLTASAQSTNDEELNCVIAPNRVINLSTAVEGVISELKVEKGDVVKKGQVLGSLQSDVERESVALAKMRVDMQAQIAARKEQLSSAQRKYDRSVELSDRKFISSEMLDEIRTDLEVARLNYEDALENRRLAEVELNRAQAQYNLRQFESPIDGIVVERFLSEGEFAQAQTILRLASIDPLKVEVVAPIALYGSIKAGMKATIAPEAPLSGSYEATVKQVDQIVDAASGLFGIRLDLPNPNNRLPAGIECTVRFDR
ncbi:MAG: efflux RND transporter periplasmic adaptor subunit [Gammaproteobacteria bacterium]|nr:efflux RND transporter periplasmic adaptor subunit [Gammaproteobacteria bacterium]